MKVGETVEVNIGQAVVAQAKIVEFDGETATLVVPATRVVMSVKTQLDTTPAPTTPETTHAILGLENETTPDTPVRENEVRADALDGVPLETSSAATPPPDGNVEVAAAEDVSTSEVVASVVSTTNEAIAPVAVAAVEQTES